MYTTHSSPSEPRDQVWRRPKYVELAASMTTCSAVMQIALFGYVGPKLENRSSRDSLPSDPSTSFTSFSHLSSGQVS